MTKFRRLLQKAFHTYLYEFRLQKKLLISFSAMSIILLGISSLVITGYISHFVEKQLLNSATETFDQTTISLQSTLCTYDQLSTGLARSDLFDDLMARNMDNYTHGQISAIRQSFERSLFASLQSYVSNTSYEVALKIYFNDGFDYFNNRTRYYSLNEHLSEPWVASVISQYDQSRGGFYVIPESQLVRSPDESAGHFALVRVVMDKQYYPHILALMRMDISTEYLSNMITTNAFDNTLSAVIDRNTDILALSDPNARELFSALNADYNLWRLPSGSWNEITLGREKYLIRTVSIPEYQLLQFSLIPASSLYNDVHRIRSFLILICVLMFLLCIPLANLVSRALVFRLKSVVTAMHRVQEGVLSPFHEDGHTSSDEVGELIDSYNYMVEQIKLLMQQEYDHGAKIKSAELKALQAQINPHFLYNSLDMIHWFAMENKMEEIEKSVRSLALFYRIGLSNGREIITLREEIAQTRAYMDLWNLRLQDAIFYEVRAEEELLDCLIIKTTLQPLLENAVSHGIREKTVPVGVILLQVLAEGEDILITIRDDGAGIDPETLDKLNRDTLITESTDHGYGVHSVQSRLQLCYGSAYGLHFESVRGEGTAVTVHIPKKTIG